MVNYVAEVAKTCVFPRKSTASESLGDFRYAYSRGIPPSLGVAIGAQRGENSYTCQGGTSNARAHAYTPSCLVLVILMSSRLQVAVEIETWLGGSSDLVQNLVLGRGLAG